MIIQSTQSLFNKKRLSIWLFFATIAGSFTSGTVTALATDEHLRDAGDVLQIALPVTAFLSTYLYDDPEGRVQFGKSFLTSWTTVYAIKGIGNKVRPGDIDPEEEGNLSFPSGHTMGAFCGASFLQTRYGWVWGFPAYLLAGLTAYSRIDAQAHYFDDVIAGAGISMLSNWYYTTAHPKKVYLFPRVGARAYALELQIPMDGDNLTHLGETVTPKWQFSLFMGPSWPTRANAKASSESGTPIDLTDFDNDLIANAYISVGRFLGKRHDIQFKLMPMEKRQNGTFANDISFAGQDFSAGEVIRTRYRLNEWHLRYRYALLPESPFDLNVGAGLGYFDAKVTLTNLETGRDASAEDSYLLPLAHLSTGYRFNPQWRITIGTDFYHDTDSWHDELFSLVHYRADPNWEITAGYRGWAGEVDEPDMAFRYTFHGFTLGFTYLCY